MEKNSWRATEEGSLFQDEQTCNKCCMFNEEQEHHSLQVALTEYLIPFIICVKCVDPGDDWASQAMAEWCPRPKTPSPPWWPDTGSLAVNIRQWRLKRHHILQTFRYKEIVKQGRAISSWYGKLICRHLLVYTYCSYRATLSLIRVVSVHLVNASTIFILF